MKKIFSKLRSNGSSREESDGGTITNVIEDEDDAILDERISDLKRRIEESNKRLQFLQEKAQLYEFHQKLMKSADNALTSSSAKSRSFSGKHVSKHRRINSTATGPQRKRDPAHRTVSHMSLFTSATAAAAAAAPPSQNVTTSRLPFEPPKDTAPDTNNTEDILSKLEEIKREKNKSKNRCEEPEKKSPVAVKKGKKVQVNSSSPLSSSASSSSGSSSSSSSSSSGSKASVRARKGTTAIFEEDRNELDFGDLSDIKIGKKGNYDAKIKGKKAIKSKGKGNVVTLNFGDLSGISLDGLQAPKAVPASSSAGKSSNNLDFGDLSGLNFEPSPSPSIPTKKPVKREKSKSPSLPLSSSLSSSSSSASFKESKSPQSSASSTSSSSHSSSSSSINSSSSGKSMSTSSLTSSGYISSSSSSSTSSSSSSISSGASSSSSEAISISSSQSRSRSSSSEEREGKGEEMEGGEAGLRHQKRHANNGRRHHHRHTESKSGTTNVNDLLAQLDEKSRASKPDLGDLSSINLDDISMPPEPAKTALPARKKGKQKGSDVRAKGNNSEKVNAGDDEYEVAVVDTPESSTGVSMESEDGAHKSKRSFFDLSILDTLAKLSRRKKEEKRKRKIEKKKKEKEKEEKEEEKERDSPIKTKSKLKSSLSSSPEKEKEKEKEKTKEREKEKDKIPAVLHYGVSEDANVAGLHRGKKKTTFTKGKGILSAKAHDLMDDAHITITPFFGDASQALFGVFDGYAGPEAARAACKHFPLVLRSALRRGALRSPARGIKATTWRSIYKKTDERLEGCECVGTTCTTVFCWAKGAARYLQAANVGDSLAFLCRAGKAVPLTVEHKVTNPSERKRLREINPEITDKATRVNGIAVSRCLGSSFVKMDDKSGIVCTPDVSEVFKIGTEDSFVIVASDGLWDVMSGQEACNMVRDMNEANAMSKKLIKAALKKKKCMDNVTVIVILLK